jgi:hypothetical protein
MKGAEVPSALSAVPDAKILPSEVTAADVRRIRTVSGNQKAASRTLWPVLSYNLTFAPPGRKVSISRLTI